MTPQEMRSGERERAWQGQESLKRTELGPGGHMGDLYRDRAPRSRKTSPGLNAALVPPSKAASKELKEVTASKELNYPQEQSPRMFTVTRKYPATTRYH